MTATQYADADIELEFIREFSVGGNNIGSVLGAEDRRERVRIAIYAGQLHDKRFRDSDMTYAAAYRLCYGRDLDMRRRPRDSVSSR
jgi:hypothetical protein